MFDVKYKLLENKYVGKSREELEKIFEKKKKEYDKMMSVLNPVTCGVDFLEVNTAPLWVKIAHIDEFLECPHCREEYEEKLKKMN